MSMILDMIHPELMVLVPVLYFWGILLKKSLLINNRYIPLLLGGMGIVFAVIYIAAVTPILGARDVLMVLFGAVTQGLLCAGCSVYIHQILKQMQKK